MTICIVAKYHFTERVGGAEVQAWLLARELAQRGESVAYVCESITGRGGTLQILEGVKVVWLFPRPYLDLLNFPQYARALSHLNPKIVIHRYTSGYEAVIGRYCRRKSAKFVWICTDNSSPLRHHFFTKQRDALQRHPRPLYKHLILLLHAWAKDRAREYGMQFVSHPCVQNPIQHDAFLANFARRPFRFPSGHNIPATIPTKDSPPVILWVGGFSKVKRPELFLQFAKYCDDLNLEFIMISKSVPKNVHTAPEPFYEYVATQPHFKWLTDLPFEETLSWFDRASIFVSTSESEGFPNTFIQAWSRGVPVISFDVDPDGVLVREGLGAVVDTVSGARAAVQEYLNRPNIDDLRKHLHLTAQTRFSIASVADRLFEIVNSPPS